MVKLFISGFKSLHLDFYYRYGLSQAFFHVLKLLCEVIAQKLPTGKTEIRLKKAGVLSRLCMLLSNLGAYTNSSTTAAPHRHMTKRPFILLTFEPLFSQQSRD